MIDEDNKVVIVTSAHAIEEVSGVTTQKLVFLTEITEPGGVSRIKESLPTITWH